MQGLRKYGIHSSQSGRVDDLALIQEVKALRLSVESMHSDSNQINLEIKRSTKKVSDHIAKFDAVGLPATRDY